MIAAARTDLTAEPTASGREPPAIELVNARVGYDDHVVVDAVTLSVPPGGLLALIGTNGAGKSTILKTLAGLIPPISGEVRVLRDPPGRRPRDVAYLCQNPPSSFTLPLRAADVVAMGRYASLGLLRRVRSSDRSTVQEAMRRMGVDRFSSLPLMELSGGQQQRTHLAQLLARQAKVLLVDEPTAGLDAAGREDFGRAVAEERARGVTVVVATHDLEDAETADSVLLLSPTFSVLGTPVEVLTDANLRRVFGATGQHHGPHGPHGH